VRWLTDHRTWIAAAAGVAAIIVVAVLVTRGGDDAAPADSAADRDPASQSSPGAEPSPSDDASGSSGTVSDYCTAYAAIRDGGFESDDEEEGVDLDELSRKFNELIIKYVAASGLAPSGLRDDYGTALDYLQQGKVAVDSGEVDQVRLLVRTLPELNDTIDTIQRRSDQLCG
jgi:hypothetical protein